LDDRGDRLPEAATILKPEDLHALHLSAEEALARAKTNTKAAIGRRVPQSEQDKDNVSVLWGDYYQASLLAFPELWAPLAKTYGDASLIVAAPSPNKMMFTRAHDDDAVKTLSAIAAASMQGESKPISAEVFRWTEKGWVPAAP
jgi:hypothetical protein